MTDAELLVALSVTYFLLYVILGTLVLGRLLYRVILYLTAKEPIPLLLKRDIPLFAVFVGEIGFVMFAAVYGIRLTNSVPWVFFSGLFAVIALGYWAYVEYFKIKG